MLVSSRLGENTRASIVLVPLLSTDLSRSRPPCLTRRMAKVISLKDFTNFDRLLKIDLLPESKGFCDEHLKSSSSIFKRISNRRYPVSGFEDAWSRPSGISGRNVLKILRRQCTFDGNDLRVGTGNRDGRFGGKTNRADLLWRAIGVEWKQTLGGPPSRGGGRRCVS